MSRFLIACGGTGGHLSPGIATAQALIAKGHECKLVLSRKQIDARILKKYPQMPHCSLPGVGFSLRPLRLLQFITQQIRAIFGAWRLHRSYQPDLLIAFGGFNSLAIALVARLHKTPIALHESNRRTGKAIQALSHIAQRLYLPEGSHLHGIGRASVRFCGYPIRQEIRKIGALEARKKIKLHTTGKLLLVIGGSQGADALNHWIRQNIDKFTDQNINIYCISGLGKGEAKVLQRRSQNAIPTSAIFTPFCDDMNSVLNAADLAIARSGSGSLAEFVHCQLPSILVPYPHATDAHQDYNARSLEAQGGAIIIPETRMETLCEEISKLIHNDAFLKKIHHNLQGIDTANPAEFIARDLEDMLAPKANP